MLTAIIVSCMDLDGMSSSPEVISRRRPIIIIATAAALLAAAVGWYATRVAAPPGETFLAAPDTPSATDTPVIIYLIDTLRADRLGLYGYGKPTSPRIDALARESVVFDRAYSAAPWTLPSLASLITSRYPCEHGVLRVQQALSPVLPTLAEQLQRLGYSTGAYYQNNFAGPIAGLHRGFQVDEYRNDMETLDLDTVSFIQKAGNQPFFLYLHSMEPHASYFAPPDLIRKFGHVSIDDREAYRAHWIAYRLMWYADSHAARRVGSTDTTRDIDMAISNISAMRDSVETLYDASVAFADRELGQTIDRLRDSGVWDRALFILLSDHGEELADHGLWFHDQSLYEEMIRVPLLVHFPRDKFGGRRIDQRVSLLDVMPTVLDYLGQLEACVDCRGSSLLALLDPGRDGEYASSETPSVRMNVVGYYRQIKEQRGDINVVVRRGQRKAIWNKEPGNLELYDLTSDPAERQNLASSLPQDAQTLAQQAEAWFDECLSREAPPIELPPEAIDDQNRERLKAHGYFGQ